MGFPARRAGSVLAEGLRGADIEGVVVKRYVPPPCPPGAQCKPTPPQHLEVADPSEPSRMVLRLAVRDVGPFTEGEPFVLSTCLFAEPELGMLHGRVKSFVQR